MNTITTNNQNTATASQIIANARGTLSDLISAIRKGREARKHSPFYHDDKAARLERSRSDVNKLWLGQL